MSAAWKTGDAVVVGCVQSAVDPRGTIQEIRDNGMFLVESIGGWQWLVHSANLSFDEGPR